MVRHPRVVRPISLESSVRQLPAHVSLCSLASRGIDQSGKRLLVFLRSVWLGIIPLTHSTKHVLIQLGFAHLGGSWGLEAIPSHRTGALADHGVEGVGEHPPRAAIQAAHVLEVAGLPQVPLHEAYPALVVQLQPDGDRLIGKATIRERDDEWPTDLQDTPDLSQDVPASSVLVMIPKRILSCLLAGSLS
jgi:hypothetical protein